MADAPPAASGQRSVTLDLGAIGSGLGDGIDIEEAYRLVATAMENDAELMAAVGAARERAVETVRGNLAAKSARGGLEEYRRALDAAFEDAIDDLTASMGMTASPDQKNTFNSAFDAFAAANASIYKSSADFRRECVDLLAKRALAELGSPVPADFDAQSRISDYIGELSREQAAKTISSLHGLKVSEVLAAGRKRIAQALGELMRRLRAVLVAFLIAGGTAYVAAAPLVRSFAMMGASLAYASTMALLAILFVAFMLIPVRNAPIETESVNG